MINADILADERYYFGIACLKYTDGGIVPRRMSDKYLNFCDRAEPFRTFAQSCSSVKLQFRTDAKKIKLHCHYRPVTGDKCNSGLYIVGKYHSSFAPEKNEAHFDGIIFHSTESRLRRFQIYFHYHAHITLCSIAFEGAINIEPLPVERPVWLALGDSITEGAEAEHPSDIYVETTARLLDLDTINLGIGGENMEPEHAVVALDYNFDFATVAYGANDCGNAVPLSTYFDKTKKVISVLLKTNKPIIFISPIPRLDESSFRNDAGHIVEDYRQILEQLTVGHDRLSYINGKCLLPPDPKYFFDPVHPNRAGHIQYGHNLAQTLSRLPIFKRNTPCQK